MAKPSKFEELVRTATQDVVAHPRDLTRHYSDKLGISRVAANRYVRRLEKEGWIARSGTSTHPVFSPGFRRRIAHLTKLKGLQEDLEWNVYFRPYLSLQPNVLNLVVHGFTEMVNNAIDHSDGTVVFIWADQHENDLRIIVSDDGIGIFEKITKALDLPDPRQALFELSKGKLTTDPENHSGEGVFFTSRMFDLFEITANGLRFNHEESSANDVLEEVKDDLFPEGTTVYMRIGLDSKRTAEEIFQQFTSAPEDYDFSRTIVPMRLAQYGDEQLVSRSQAKRLIARFERFRTVVLDFQSVTEIGRAFADELFRVYHAAHPNIELVPINLSEQVERMWRRSTTSGNTLDT